MIGARIASLQVRKFSGFHAAVAMSLLNPPFAWSLAALLVPLWLHLSRRRKYKEVQVGTLRFLNEVLKERRKRSRFEEVPLMILRLLGVSLLAFIFCRPFLNASQRVPENPAETVLLLDASGSVTADMKQRGLALAQKAAASVPTGSKLTMAQFSDDVETIAEAGKWTPRAGAPTDLTRAMSWALDRLGSAGAGRAGKIVLVAHIAAGDLPATPPRVWPPRVTLEVHELLPPSAANSAVRNVSLLTPYVAGQMELEAEVLLAADSDRTVTLRAEGIVATQKVPDGADRVIFKIKPPRDEVRGTISVAGGDAWPADDVRPFAVRWVQPRRVILVDANPGSTPFEGQAYFADKALTASGAAHGRTPFQPEIVFGLSGRKGAADLSGVGAVALCGVPMLSNADARSLAQHVDSGGGLVVVLDSRWSRGSAAVLESAGLLPAGIRSEGGDDAPVRAITEWDRAHPILASFDGREGGDLRDAEWRDGFDIPADEGWKVLARLDGGHALLLEKSRTAKQGRVVVLAHSLTREWTDLPHEPLFVPLVKSLFTYVSQAETARPEVPPRHPGVHEHRVPGTYADASGATEIVASAPSESSVTTASADALRAAFGVPDANAQSVASHDDPALASASVPWRRELWPWAAALLLVLLMIENLIATRQLARNP